MSYISADAGTGALVPDLVARAGERMRLVVTATAASIIVVVMQWRLTGGWVQRTSACTAEMLLD